MKKIIFLIIAFFQLASADCITPPYERLIPCESSFFITGDLLYWQAWREDLEYTWEMVPVHPFDPSKEKIHRRSLKQEWDLGFRVGIGYGMPEDGWSFYLNWTRFHQTLTASKSSDTPIFATLYIQPIQDIGLENGALRALGAKGKWELAFDTLDFQIGREYWLSYCLHVYPHLGVKTAWIDQDFRIFYTSVFLPLNAFPLPPLIDLGDRQFQDRNNRWGIGPRAGFESDWVWGCGFSLVGEVAGALLWTDTCHALWPTLQMGIGLEYGSSFWSDCLWLGLQIKYEAQFWWTRTLRDLSLQGLTVSGRVEF